ncbi:MAG: glutamate racemase [Bacteroidetes bacterium]|nr:glutamate racemase [Bacteroidota bacterium]
MKKQKILTKTNPIGIFDSGIGGLTVADAIHRLLPSETLIYFGDTAHLPYGDKAPESIQSYSIRIADYLLDQGCKMIVIACNTASSIAYEAVKKHVGSRATVIDVINPVVAEVSSMKKIKHIGVIGTRATIRSNAYAIRIEQQNPNLKVSSLATPLLAPMIEEGFFNNKISRTIINSYLSRPKIKKIDALILACTHYPLIKAEIIEYYKKNINIVDSADIVARFVRESLASKDLLNSGKARNHKFYISDYTKSFEQSTKIFFKGKLKLEHKNLWNDTH